MLELLQGFVRELRRTGLPVSATENVDAMRAVEVVELSDRAGLRAALAATLVKHHRHRRAFDAAFDVYFSPHGIGRDGDGPASAKPGEPADLEVPDVAGEPTRDELVEMLLDALVTANREDLRRLVALAVSLFAGIEPGRPVGGTYYVYRALRALDLDGLAEVLVERMLGSSGVDDQQLAQRLTRDEMERRLRELRDLVEMEVRRRLVADRGPEEMARVLRRPLPEDVEFMHASRDQVLALQHAITPLARALASRLSQRRRRRRRGHLDFRRTVRASLSYGGVPVEPRFRRPHPSKPEVVLLVDVSGSVASFARFTLQFVYAMASQFSKVRSWAFIDGIDEVTRFFQEAGDVGDAVQRVSTEADVVWADGHSDYGHAFVAFQERHALEITSKTSVIVLGDARSNYHPPEAWALGAIGDRARHVYWLNPEPGSYWNTGDSIMGEYVACCDGVFECRNLRQLQRFVSEIAGGR